MIAEGLSIVLASSVSSLSTSIAHMTCPCDCRHEYGEAELTLELVNSMDEAIDHLHAHGSGHTECIITGECQGLHPETCTHCILNRELYSQCTCCVQVLTSCCCCLHAVVCQMQCISFTKD